MIKQRFKMIDIKYYDWGVVPYDQALQKQRSMFNDKISIKLNNPSQVMEQDFIVCSHPHVYTMGKHGNENNLLVSSEFLKKINATYFHIERGGDITYHGPGQIVGYPILDLEVLNLSLKEYINIVEQTMIQMLSLYGIKAQRLAGATGVWLDVDKKNARKICAIGVRASRYITMHGFALNVNTDLNYFNYINPCGFKDKGVTSMQKELGTQVEVQKVKTQLYEIFTHLVSKVNE
jgi:lipoate-protein ligase B